VALREADWLSGRNAAPMETQTSCQGIKLAKLYAWEANKERDTRYLQPAWHHPLALSWNGIVQRDGSEPVFLNVYGAPELILRNEFRQPM
jgi:hypothetical protein